MGNIFNIVVVKLKLKFRSPFYWEVTRVTGKLVPGVSTRHGGLAFKG
jgi:hypothetical protein